MSTFQYSPLAPREIRVLQVQRLETPTHYKNLRLLDALPFRERGDYRTLKLADNADTPLRCTLSNIPLDGQRCFEAISHTWGDATATREITVNDQIFRLRENAYYGLLSHRVRRRTGCRHGIWLDSICINQNDEAEKSAQVQMMGDIYSSACEVTIWLGAEADNSNLAMDFLLPLYDLLVDERLQSMERGERGVFVLERTSEDEELSPQWRALGALLNRAYFTRIWIVQEVALAAFAWVECGDRYCTWALLADVAHLIRKLELLGLLGDDELKNPPGIFNIGHIEDIKTSEKEKLGDLMAKFTPWAATNPKDKVYALLGISSDASELRIVPDYTLELEQVWTSVYRAILLNEKDFEMLGFAGCGQSGRSGLPRLRSWVPDLSSRMLTCPYSTNASWNGYAAARDTKPVFHFDELDQMIVQGVVVDKVKVCGSMTRFLVEDLAIEADHRLWLEEILLLAKATREREGIPFNIEEFWRSLIGNVTPYDGVAPACYGDYFNSYRVQQNGSIEYIMADKNQVPGKNVLEQRAHFGLTTQVMKEAELFELALNANARTRRFCITEQGRYAFVPEDTGSNFGRTWGEDYICILSGSPVPWVIRRPYPGAAMTMPKNCGWLLGQAYVHGLMLGEGLEGREMGEFTIG